MSHTHTHTDAPKHALAARFETWRPRRQCWVRSAHKTVDKAVCWCVCVCVCVCVLH